MVKPVAAGAGATLRPRCLILGVNLLPDLLMVDMLDRCPSCLTVLRGELQRDASGQKERNTTAAIVQELGTRNFTSTKKKPSFAAL